MSISAKDHEALDWLRRRGGEVLITYVPDRDEYDVLGSWTPGMARFKRLAKLDLVFVTEEEPLDLGDGEFFDFTPSLCLVE